MIMYRKISSLQGMLGLVTTFRRVNEESNLYTGVCVCVGGNQLVQEKCELKQAHPVWSRLRWIYGSGVSGVAEELPSLTARNGKSFGRKVEFYFNIQRYSAFLADIVFFVKTLASELASLVDFTGRNERTGILDRVCRYSLHCLSVSALFLILSTTNNSRI